MVVHAPFPPLDIIVRCYSSQAGLSEDDKQCLRQLTVTSAYAPAKSRFVPFYYPLFKPQFLLSGWAMDTLFLSDGRRQVVDFNLPGELLTSFWCTPPPIPTSLFAVTDVTISSFDNVSSTEEKQLLQKIYGIAQCQKQSRYYLRIVAVAQRAQERLACLLVDLYERLSRVGLVKEKTFDLPINQETIADFLGLSTVHVNRMFQRLRLAKIIELRNNQLSVLDLEKLASLSNTTI